MHYFDHCMIVDLIVYCVYHHACHLLSCSSRCSKRPVRYIMDSDSDDVRNTANDDDEVYVPKRMKIDGNCVIVLGRYYCCCLPTPICVMGVRSSRHTFAGMNTVCADSGRYSMHMLDIKQLALTPLWMQ